MKRLATLSLFLLVMVNAQAQFALVLDSVVARPAHPVVGDSVKLFIYGYSNKEVHMQPSPFIGNSGHEHTFTACYLGSNLATPTYIRDSATLFYANVSSMDTIYWFLNQNKIMMQNACDTAWDSDTIYLQIMPTGVIAFNETPPQIGWGLSTHTLKFTGFTGSMMMQLWTSDGRMIRSEKLSQGQREMQIGTPAPGIYLVSVKDEDGTELRQKILVQ